jgi:hypothetical protein
MPLQRTETYTTSGIKGSWNCDPSIAPFNVNVAAVLVGGPVSYTLQYSFDVLDDPLLTDSDATWFNSSDLPAGTTASGQANFSTPIARIRVVIASITGSLKVTMLQGMSIN